MKILPFFLLISSCGWLNADKGFPENEPTPPPPVDISVAGTDLVYYVPDIDSFSEEKSEKCRVEDIERIVGPYKVETNSINFIYETVDFDESFTTNVQGLDRVSYLHPKEIWFEISAGEDFDFFSWAKISIGDQLVAWGGPHDADLWNVELEVDGSVELKQYLDNDQVRITGEVRGRAPRTDTWIQTRMILIGFYDCE